MSQPKSIPDYRLALKAAEAKVARLEAENAQLKERVRKLEGQLEAAQRAAKRQAAPFSRGKRKPSGRPPGRRSGAEHGRHAQRQTPDRVDEELFAELPEAESRARTADDRCHRRHPAGAADASQPAGAAAPCLGRR